MRASISKNRRRSRAVRPSRANSDSNCTVTAVNDTTIRNKFSQPVYTSVIIVNKFLYYWASPICNDARSCMVVCAPPFSPCRGPYIPARHAQSPYAPPYPSLLHTVVFRSDTDLAARCRTTDHQSVRQTRCKRWRIIGGNKSQLSCHLVGFSETLPWTAPAGAPSSLSPW